MTTTGAGRPAKWKHLLVGAVLAIGTATVATTAASSAPGDIVFDDMEHGDPFGNGWFQFFGSGSGGISANGSDLPPTDGGAFSLESGWGAGGTPGFFGGFGRTSPTDITGADAFSFWIDPDAGQDYTLEINLQEDETGDGVEDEEFQYNCVVAPGGACAVAGGGWQLVSIPLADFFDDDSFITGGDGVLGTDIVNVVWAVIGNSGSDADFRTDFWAFSSATAEPSSVIDDFEIPLSDGFNTFSDGSPVSIAITDTPPALVPDADPGNSVLDLTTNVPGPNGFAGFAHTFDSSDPALWVSQDWSAYEGFRLWVYGRGSGTTLFIDLIDNRPPGSTTDNAGRYFVSFVDDFIGWQQLAFPFADFERKRIGNDAPNDGLTLTEMHGWALGAQSTGGDEVTWFVDDAEIYGEAVIPPLAVTFTQGGFDVAEGATGDVVVKLNRPMNSDDPAQVSVDFTTADGTATADRDYIAAASTLTFVNGGSSQLTVPITTLDDSKFEGTETVLLSLSNPVDVELGFFPTAFLAIADSDPYDPYLLDDFETAPYQWTADGVDLPQIELADSDDLARPGQDAFEGVQQVDGPIAVDLDVTGTTCKRGNGVVEVHLLSTPDFDATSVDPSTIRFGGAAPTTTPKPKAADVDKDGLDDLRLFFRASEFTEPCDGDLSFVGETADGQGITAGGADASFNRDFALGQDWTDSEAVSFWFYGTGSGGEVTVDLLDNRAPDPGPDGWSLVWSDEFDEGAGTPPDPEIWAYEIGDGSVNGIPGWGNDERQYYTDDPANVSQDGEGNLEITLLDGQGEQCFYGPCEYTSARLITKEKYEVAYGRVEARVKVPDGPAGLWPAFWSLGTDIDVVNWPQTGEIDVMEYVSRLPNEIFGTIHGPGYAGGQSYGNELDIGVPVSDEYHTYTIDWQPDLIEWYFDDQLYHTATPADVAPNEWVFNDPVFLLLNMAIGGNFGGTIDPGMTVPQTMDVDFVRVYQGPDTAERFEATFTDGFVGWQEVTVPFSDFVRSGEQPAGAPDDGLTLTDVWGYGFTLPDTGLNGGTTWIDQVRLDPLPPPTELTVTNADNAGDGSLRDALDRIAPDGTITIDPALAGETVALSGPIVPSTAVTIDSSGAPGFALDGGASDRTLIVDAGLQVTVDGLTLTNGYGFQLAGCVLNNGTLTLENSTVTGCTMTTDAGDFWQGGGGIYNADGATLNLIDSTVSDNSSGWTGGGVYSFFNSTTNVTRSTISGNTAADVGGGLRTLGTVNIDNSTISGNSSSVLAGGGMFVTDGVAAVTSSTITDNSAEAGQAGGIFVGTFTDSAASMTIQNSIVAGNPGGDCLLAPWGSGPVSITSLGNNVFDGTGCNSIASDEVVIDAGLGLLAANGGPTLTHELLSGSPAIDAANGTTCPAVDQRGVGRPVGGGCDVGSVESF